MLTTVVSFQGIADARTPAALETVTYVLAPRCHYVLALHHPDGWKAEFVLLVHSDERATHLAELIGQWRTAGNRAVPLLIRALSFPQAAALFRSRLQPLAESDPAT